MHLPEPFTSQILILVSMPADSSRWPCFGKKRMAETPLEWPLLSTAAAVSLDGHRTRSGPRA